MYNKNSNPLASMESFAIEGKMFRYSSFVPRLYNLCLALGFEPGKIMPSRAFCSDESQGYPIILIAKHFNSFPFNHGMVGGVVATDRHGPHAHHGQDLLIIQASHVGFYRTTQSYGLYRRMQTSDRTVSACCGKIGSVLSWYESEYHFARENIYIARNGPNWWITIDNHLLNERRPEGLFLHLDKLIQLDGRGQAVPVRALSTSKSFALAKELIPRFEDKFGEDMRPLGTDLQPEWYHFQRSFDEDEVRRNHLEQNLFPAMPWILAAKSPLLAAAKINTQGEFDRAYRTIVREPEFRGKRVFFIAGLNIDISQESGQMFPLTKFIPWAASILHPDGAHRVMEQDELYGELQRQSSDNPHQTDLEAAIRQMSVAEEVRIPGA